MERQLQQQVLRRGQRAELAAPRAAARPEPLAVEREEPRRRHDAPVQLEDPVSHGIAEGPRVVAAHHLLEARGRERRRSVGETFEREDVDVRHGPLGFDAAHRLGEHGSLERQRPDPDRVEERQAAGGEAELSQRPHQERPALRGERRHDRSGPLRRLALERVEQQRHEALLARRFEDLLGARGFGRLRQGSAGRELTDVASRL